MSLQPHEQLPKAVTDFKSKADGLAQQYEQLHQSYVDAAIKVATYKLFEDPRFTYNALNKPYGPFALNEALSMIRGKFPDTHPEHVEQIFSDTIGSYKTMLEAEKDRDYKGEHKPLIENTSY